MTPQDDERIIMDKLGIEPVQLLTQIFNFVVMVILMSKFLYKPILKALEDRRKKIQAGLEYAEKMQVELEKTGKKRQEVIDAAKEEARKIIEESKKTGKLLEAEIVEKAHNEAAVILDKGRKELEMERVDMEKQLTSQTVDIAQTWVETVLGKVLSVKNQQQIINKKLQELAHHVK